MNIPILRVPFPDEAILGLAEGLRGILASGQLTQGRYTARFEEEFAAFSGAAHALACSSGTSALELILQALGVEGRSVLVPTNTFLATGLAAIHTGNQVVFADSDPATFGLDVADVERRLTPDVAAVIAVHIGGVMSPALHDLARLCRARGVHLIEDCAHAHGSSVDGHPAGTVGVAGAFSFFPTKVLTTGEGGMVVTQDPEIARRVGILRNQGKDPALGGRIGEPGGHHRMSEITALLGVDQMTRARSIVEERRRIARDYDAALQGLARARPLAIPENVFSTYYKYIVMLDSDVDRARLKASMKSVHGVSLTGEVYADLCHEQPIWERYTRCGRPRSPGAEPCRRSPECGCDQPMGRFPGAEYLSRHHICLPLYPSLSRAEVDHVTASLRQALSEAG